MKQKELIQLLVAGTSFVVHGIIIFSQFGPGKSKSAKNRYTYENVKPIAANFDAELLQSITNTEKVKDFYLPPDLHNGIGNPTPFKPSN